MIKTGPVVSAMIAYEQGHARRINHFIKVHGFAKAIGEMEMLDTQSQEILEVAALTHDIGIKNSELKYGSSAGKYQQAEGPPEAQRLLEKLGYSPDLTDRVCWLIAHHHTYHLNEGSDYQILIEADFLVNAFEETLSETAIRNINDTVFKTRTGKLFLKQMFPLI